MPEGMKRTDIADGFVREHAVSVNAAESFVHLGADAEYHPTGGYWFPSDLKHWDEHTGIVKEKSDVPDGKLIQFPCDDRDPEIVGRDELPDWVVNRHIDVDETDQFDEYEEKLDELNEGLLEAYAAGFSKAKEVYDITKGPRDVQALMDTEGVSENHYYYWDGRTKPLLFWLREQFDIDSDE